MDQIATDIGSRLRQAREQRGLTLRDIAAITKISMTALTAIEHNDFARLPGGVFRRAYLRAFAAEVGLNGDELAREYRAKFEPEPPAEPLPRDEADGKNRFRLPRLSPGVLATIAGLLVCGSLILDWSPVPREASDARGMPDAVAADLAASAARTDGPEGPEDVALANAAVADGRASLRLEIRTRGPCWVSAVADGERVVYRLMQPGDHALVEARATIRLRVGDAGTVVYSINGAAGRPLGRDGDVVTVHFTNDNLGSWYAEPASPESPKGAATTISRGPDRHWQASGSRAEAS